MNSDLDLTHSLDLAKAGFDNAQERIGAIDTKVGIAVGLLLALLPVPLVVVGWAIGLANDIENNPYAKSLLETCPTCWFSSLLLGLGLFVGMVGSMIAIWWGVACLSPRGPKGYGDTGAFKNEWRPNILFPIYKTDKLHEINGHIQKIETGTSMEFMVAEYKHQLIQLGGILDGKFNAMSKCFKWLKVIIVSYGVAIIFGVRILLFTLLK